MAEKVKLVCSVVNISQGMESDNYTYVVRDSALEVVATGVSGATWVRHDAGGYHTRNNFDDRYGVDGWIVEFDSSVPGGGSYVPR